MSSPFANQVLDRCRSTNDLARELGEKGYPHGTWISARAQEAGRGRLGRSWDSREGNLFMSWVLRPQEKSRWTWVPLTIAVGAALAAKEWGISLRIKWPNDLWSADGAKVGGILCEGVGHKDGSFIVAGLGLNCSHSPEGLDQETTCLSKLLPQGGKITADDVRDAIHRQVLEQVKRLQNEGPAVIRAEYESMAAFPRGTEVTWVTQNGEPKQPQQQGVVEGIGDSGELVVRSPGGDLRKLYAEDIKLRASNKHR